MNFGKFDAIMLLTMSLAVISMSFVFPAIGLAGDDDTVSSNDIPELDIETDRFNIAGELPNRPRSTDSGTLIYRSDGFDNRDIHLLVDSGNLLVTNSAFAEGGGNTTPIRVFLTEFDTNGNQIDQSNTSLSNVGQQAELTVDNQTEYTVRYTLDEISGNGTGDFEAKVRFQVIESPGNDGFLGTIFGAADTLASTVAWIGTVFYWFSISLFEIAGNALGAIFDVTSYLLSLITWLITSYTSIIASSSGFATVFVTIPGIILGIMLAKVLVIGIKILPTT